MTKGIREECLKIITECFELTEKELCEKYEKAPLEFDSFVLFELVLQLEDQFEIEYHDFDELTLHMKNLDDLIGYLVKLIQEKGVTKNES